MSMKLIKPIIDVAAMDRTSMLNGNRENHPPSDKFG